MICNPAIHNTTGTTAISEMRFSMSVLSVLSLVDVLVGLELSAQLDDARDLVECMADVRASTIVGRELREHQLELELASLTRVRWGLEGED